MGAAGRGRAMNVLGVFGATDVVHPAACLLRDGRLIAFAEEERFARVKQACGLFPARAMAWCLREARLVPGDVDAMAFGWDANVNWLRMPVSMAQSFVGSRLSRSRATASAPPPGRPEMGAAALAGLQTLLHLHPWNLQERLILAFRDGGFVRDPIPPLRFYKHHLCHAATAFYCSGMKEAAVLVFDGHGEERTVSIYHGEGRSLREVRHVGLPHSLGWFYCATTEYLGWDANEGEVKLMGLAPYGRPNASLRSFFEAFLQLTPDGVRIDPDCIFYGRRSYGRFFGDKVADRLGPPRAPDEEITQHHRDIAFAVQRRLEEAALHLARLALRDTGSRNLCVAGGVALNCKMTGALHRAHLADHLFVQPLAYDAGAALGAAMLAAEYAGDDCRFVMEHVHYGPAYNDAEIEAVLRRNGLVYRHCHDIADAAAGLVAEGKVVGWFQGRMEAGPRALGGRSILADPRDAAMSDTVNDKVKFRERWRPFALSILAERAADYLVDAVDAPFMVMAFEVVRERQADIAAALHSEDRTTRPHTVRRDVNPLFWALIDAFRRRTGVPGVLNTSFNVKGEPVVCSPTDAIRCFYGSGMDALAIGSFLVEKTGSGRLDDGELLAVPAHSDER
jgi:carbamoyltransferase